MFGQKSTSPAAANDADARRSVIREVPSPTSESTPDKPEDEGVADQIHIGPEIREHIRQQLVTRIEPTVAVTMSNERLRSEIAQFVAEIADESRLHLNEREQEFVAEELSNDMIGIGPIEPLMQDPEISDILVNGPDQVYVERQGKLELTNYKFRDNEHVMHIAQRIAASVGRRIDESSPMVDARLPDGSRVNVIANPLSLKGVCISIRKFSKERIDLDFMTSKGSLSAEIATFLKVATKCKLNILISGGTGAGKTTLLNALSHEISASDRIVTIEDAAELQLQQPHVVSLETRPENTEGQGEVTQRDLVRNSLRMRPDRIIIGEVRGAEAFDMMQAMNTGHDGSMGTIHANTPRDALTRLENMLLMGAFQMPTLAIRRQIVGAIHIIIQVERMRDGGRRITKITEVMGMEGEIVVTQDLFEYEYEGEASDGRFIGSFKSAGLRPSFMERAKYYGLEQVLMSTIQ